MGETTIGTLHLICGLPCSGKTTLAKQIEHERSALRLTPDEWIIRLFGNDLSLTALDAARDPVEGVLWDLAARVLVLGLDVAPERDCSPFSLKTKSKLYRRTCLVSAETLFPKGS